MFEITDIREDDESKQLWGLRYDCSTARVTDPRCLIECWYSSEEKMGPVQHKDVLVYFNKLTSGSRIPKSAQDAIAASCFRIGEEEQQENRYLENILCAPYQSHLYQIESYRVGMFMRHLDHHLGPLCLK